MGTVFFDERDAAILYCIPKPPSDLDAIVRCFMFINRAGAPTNDQLTNCLTKAMGVGIVRNEGGRFVVNSDWYDRIHRNDATAANEIESLLEFTETFVNREFHQDADTSALGESGI